MGAESVRQVLPVNNRGDRTGRESETVAPRMMEEGLDRETKTRLEACRPSSPALLLTLGLFKSLPFQCPIEGHPPARVLYRYNRSSQRMFLTLEIFSETFCRLDL